MQFGEPDGPVGVGDVAERAAGADRGELLVVTDQPDTAAASDDEMDGGVKGKSARPSLPRRSPPGSTDRCFASSRVVRAGWRTR